MLTIPCEDRDHPQWHRGVPHAAVWALEIPWDLAAPRRHLTGLLTRHDRQAHVTLAYGGLIGPEFSDALLRADLAVLRGLLTEPVTVRGTSWGTFATAPYLAVTTANAWLERVHTALSAHAPWRRLDSHVPHVTLGLHAVARPVASVHAELDRIPIPARRLMWVVPAISLLRYDTADVAGPLTTIGRLWPARAESEPEWDGPPSLVTPAGRTV